MNVFFLFGTTSYACLRLLVIGLSACDIAALAWASFNTPIPRVVYNPTDSVAVGWYRIEPIGSMQQPSSVGSIVLTHLPADALILAAQRGYLPAHIPLLKRVGAVAPQHVCIMNGEVRIDGRPVAAVLLTDSNGRSLSPWPGCRQLKSGELFLLSTASCASFDSRYFGPVRTSGLKGIARPLVPEMFIGG